MLPQPTPPPSTIRQATFPLLPSQRNLEIPGKLNPQLRQTDTHQRPSPPDYRIMTHIIHILIQRPPPSIRLMVLLRILLHLRHRPQRIPNPKYLLQPPLLCLSL